MWQRIDRRVDVMMEQGLADEVRRLLDSGLDRRCTAMQAIGYKEMVQAVMTGGDVLEAAEEVKLRSRQYAKRQLTWFRRDERINWIYMDENLTEKNIIDNCKNVFAEQQGALQFVINILNK